MPADQVIAERRFNGPPNSANGGYTCGLVAAARPGQTMAVSLLAPPPLDTQMVRQVTAEGIVELLDAGLLIARAVPTDVAVEPLRAPDLQTARAASSRYSGFEWHAFPTCFVCGPDRMADGMKIFSGPIDSPDRVAATWVPDREMAIGKAIDPIYLWSALDCPGYFAAETQSAAVLASMALRQNQPVPAGQELIVSAWRLSREGRKHLVASCLYDIQGNALAIAESLWIEPRG